MGNSYQDGNSLSVIPGVKLLKYLQPIAGAVKRKVLVMSTSVLVLVISGCGGGSAFILGTPPNNTPQSSSAVTISLQSSPTGSVPVGSKSNFAAVVNNDPSNYGVDWIVTCAVQNCGSLSLGFNVGESIHANSGQAVTYATPSSFAGNQLSVNIVAYATADHSKNVAAPINVTGFASQLKGTYVFQAQGSNRDTGTGVLGPYQIAGVLTLDGSSGVTGGEQTFTDSSTSGSTSITGGAYFLGADGRGTLTVNTNDPTLGASGAETFSLVSLDGSNLLIAQIDTDASAAGKMELQTSTSAPSGSYAFVVSGTGGGGVPTAFGGVLNIDEPSSGVISGAGSLADQGSITTTLGKTTVKVKNCAPPTATGAVAGISGTILAIPSDPYSAMQLTLTTCFASTPLQFTGYIVDATQIKLIETDISGNTGFSTSGIAISQGSSADKFSAQSFSGAYVFAASGSDKSKFASSLASAGSLVADGAGNAQGLLDQFGFSATRNFSGSLTGTYTIDSSGIGRVDTKTSLVGTNGVSSSGPEFVFYLTGGNNSPLLLAFDATALAVGAGLAYPQAAPPYQLSGDYGFNGLDLPKRSTGSSTDVTGQFSATADQTTTNSDLAGILVGPTLAYSLTGSFSAPSVSGRSSGSLSVSSFSGLPNPAAAGLYMVDNQRGFLVETDSGIQGPVFLEYFAARTPVCPACP